jgi:hypothetical protein
MKQLEHYYQTIAATVTATTITGEFILLILLECGREM